MTSGLFVVFMFWGFLLLLFLKVLFLFVCLFFRGKVIFPQQHNLILHLMSDLCSLSYLVKASAF